MKYYILYNPLAGNRKSARSLDKSVLPQNAEHIYCDITKIPNYKKFLSEISPKDKIVICGGDGTINRFINTFEGIVPPNDIFYFAAGSGNDFMHDLDLQSNSNLLYLNTYLENLPYVTIKGQEYRFLNGIGFGIDGEVCSEGNRIRSKRKNDRPIHYTPIALKSLLFGYKPTNAKITVDGKEYNFKKVWLATTMKGRYFGGGMMIAPNQNRSNPEGEISLIVGHNLSKLKILSLFPLIYKGKHISHTGNVAVFTGHNIKVEYDRSTALQIDGETMSDVLSYSVTTGAKKEITL